MWIKIQPVVCASDVQSNLVWTVAALEISRRVLLEVIQLALDRLLAQGRIARTFAQTRVNAADLVIEVALVLDDGIGAIEKFLIIRISRLVLDVEQRFLFFDCQSSSSRGIDLGGNLALLSGSVVGRIVGGPLARSAFLGSHGASSSG